MKKVIGILAVTLLSITISCKDNKVQEEGTMHNNEMHPTPKSGAAD